MKRLSLAILGTAAILTSGLAGPALAKGTMARDANDKQVTAHKTHRHMQHHAGGITASHTAENVGAADCRGILVERK